MMLDAERRLLQGVIAAICTVPISAAAISIARGPEWLMDYGYVSTDLDSHFRYLSGLLLAVAIGFLSCIPRIERNGARLRLLAAIVIVGGVARVVSWGAVGMPSLGHVGALAIELGVVPAVIAWQWSLARRLKRAEASVA